MVFAARLTQRGHRIATMDDLMALYEKSFSENTVAAISGLPHPTVQKFAVITVAVVGASRRFLSQITRHQNEVKFMSASLQYSNYAGQADFAVPYEILAAPAAVRELYLKSCHEGMDCYEKLCAEGIGHDAAGYATPPGASECADYQRHALSVETHHRPAGMPAQYGRNPDRTFENLAGALYLKPGAVCPWPYRIVLPTGQMPGGENGLRQKNRRGYNAGGSSESGLSGTFGRRRA